MRKKIAPPKEELYNLFIIQNKSQIFLAQHYQVSKKVVARWLKEYNIQKSVDLQHQCKNNTCLLKYGTSNIAQVERVKEKRKQTCLNKYGGTSSMADPAVSKKVAAQLSAPLISYDELYNYYITTHHSMQECADHFNLSVATIQKQLNHHHIQKTQEQVCGDRVHTNLNKYGVQHVTQLDDVIQKIKHTNLQKYGTESAMSSQEIKDKIKQNNLAKYGVPAATQAHYVPGVLDVLSSKEKMVQYLQDNFEKKPSFAVAAQKLGVGASTLGKAIHHLELDEYFDHNTSSAELEILSILQSWGVVCELHNRTVLNGQEIDIYCPGLHLGVEFNGDFWHSDLRLPKNYHLHKSELAEQQGVRLIHIYEYERNDPVKKEKLISLLRIATGKVERKIYARQCQVKPITNNEAKVLNDKIHLQGHRPAQVTYGLFYKDELVQLMSFSKTKYNRNLKNDNDWEIIRGCPGSNNIVVGGVSKLFTHFVHDYKPHKVFSYCDYNKFNGSSYETLGMTYIGTTGPDKTWIVDGKGVGRSPSRYKELKEKASYVIWGAGSKKYEIIFD